MNLDLPKFIDALHDYIARSVKPLAKRLEALETVEPRQGPAGKDGEPGPQGEPGRDGKDGQSVTVDQVLPEIRGHVDTVLEELREQVKAIPAPKDGKDGLDGKDGESVTPEQVLPEIKGQVDAVIKELREQVEAIPAPKDGKDGIDGKDGQSVTVDEILPAIEQRAIERIESLMSKWELDFERRATEKLEKAIDKIPAPRDGRDGKDGRDGLEINDLDITLADDERTLIIALQRGDDRVERSIKLNHMVYRGIWSKKQHLAGDVVTWAGSAWVATKDTESKPGTDDTWRLAVKKGRDGKDKT